MSTGIYERTKEHNQKISLALRGRKLSKEHIFKVSKTWFKKGECSGFSGQKHSDETKKKMSEKASLRVGEKNHQWKGDNVQRDCNGTALHNWVKKQLGKPQECWNKLCPLKSNNFQWANKSGEYKRDVNDWLRLCVSCHKLYDLGKLMI